MDIKAFIPQQGLMLLENFQAVTDFSFASIRIEEKVSNPAGVIYECTLFGDENYFSTEGELSFRILFDRDSQRILLDVMDVATDHPLSSYMHVSSIIGQLQTRLNHNFLLAQNG